METVQLAKTDIKGRYFFNEEDHLHMLDKKPLTGTSSVMEIVAKPLMYWAVGEGLKLLGWTPISDYKFGKRIFLPKEPRIKAAGEFLATLPADSDLYLKLLDDAYGAHTKVKNKAATKGKDLHANLEKYIKFCLSRNNGLPSAIKDESIQQFIDWSCENVAKFLWSEMHVYSETNWIGGISDCGVQLKSGPIAIIDFKSSKEAYKSQFWQVGGYSTQVEENGGFTRQGERVLNPMKIEQHIIFPFGAKEFGPRINKDVQGDINAFKAALLLYRENAKEIT